MKTKIVWFRNDLRLHDNALLSAAIAKSDLLLPVYLFDPRQFGIGTYGFAKTGNFKAKFLLEAVESLRKSLQAIGANLLVKIGKPEELLPTLAIKYQASAVYYSKEATPEEVEVEEAVIKELSKRNIDWKSYWTSTLFDLEDLPFPLAQIPATFTKFRKCMEYDFKTRAPIEAPDKLSCVEWADWGQIPSLDDFGLTAPSPDARSVFSYLGGETEGLQRLQEYFWEKDLLKDYFETRNQLLGVDYSSKFSPWLALGCLSPRYIFKQVQLYEHERTKNKSTYWLGFELLWRDFFHFTAAKYYRRFFSQNGYNGKQSEWRDDWEAFAKWKEGETGQDFVDANMKELKQTGFMSNRGRQNVASYLIHDLKVNWLMGAEYFESMLIDHDVCSNYGNWSYLAGVGADPRENRVFNVQKQANEYDPSGDYRKVWLN